MIITLCRRLIAIVLTSVVLTGLARAQAHEPVAVRIENAAPITISNADNYYQDSTLWGSDLTKHTITSDTTGAPIWTERPLEIKELARGLGAEQVVAGELTPDEFAQRVYEYIQYNIKTEFRYGLAKGSLGALIDQSGTSFDQAELLAELLAEAGIQSQFKVGHITVNEEQFGRWTGFAYDVGTTATPYGFKVDAESACAFLANGGIPSEVNSNASGTCSFSPNERVSSIKISHIWLTSNQEVYDPSFKQYDLVKGIDIAAAMGCGSDAAPTCATDLVNAALPSSVRGQDTIGTYVDRVVFDDVSTTNDLSGKLDQFSIGLQNK